MQWKGFFKKSYWIVIENLPSVKKCDWAVIVLELCITKLFRNRPNVERGVNITGGCWVNISLLVSSKYPNPSGKWFQNDKAMEWKVENSTRSMYYHIYFRVPTFCKNSLYIGYQTQACRKISRVKISWFLGHNQTPHCNKVWSEVTLSFIDQLCSDKSAQNNPNQHEEAAGWGGKFMDIFCHKLYNTILPFYEAL